MCMLTVWFQHFISGKPAVFSWWDWWCPCFILTVRPVHREGGFEGFDRTPLNPTNQSYALLRSFHSLYYSHYLTFRACVVGSNSKQAKAAWSRTHNYQVLRVICSAKDIDDIDDVESEKNLPYTWNFYTAFNLSIYVTTAKIKISANLRVCTFNG